MGAYLGRLALALLGAYLLGSVSFAIIVTRARTGDDVRKLGNRNAGAANVGRTLGRGWGAVVLALDAAKGLVALLAAKRLLFPGGSGAELVALFATGLAAVVGHCLPIYYGFRGGRGVATSLGVYFAFAPVEAFASLMIAALLVAAFVPRVPYRLGRWIPMLFAAIVPFLTLGVNAFLDIRLTPGLSIGGHPAGAVAGILALSVLLLALNGRMLLDTLRNPRAPEQL